ncbi:MAG: hypothetical protein GY793_01755 [Proteobacteria bacterium]|nr:hypothetical protein [Pseudomonadota bacterium]
MRLFKQHKHTRNIDNKDKYFIVTLDTGVSIETTIGWIEKEWNEKQFIKALSLISECNYKVLSVKECKDKKEYIKLKNQ